MKEEERQKEGVRRDLRLLFVGMMNYFSEATLAALLASEHQVCGLLLPANRPPGAGESPAALWLAVPESFPLPLAAGRREQSLATMAHQRHIPVLAVSDVNHSEVAAAVAALRPDVACVACFPWRIPPALLSLPRHGFLNLHPSLLPAYRGPTPLFWQFQQGERKGGVTVHFMDEAWDRGDIAGQTRFPFPDGISGIEAERLCAERGAALLAETLNQLAAGSLKRRPQPAGGAYFGYPTAQDFTLSREWPAQRAFNFMRATAAWGRPYPVEAGGRKWLLGQALDYSPRERLPQAILVQGKEAAVQFTPGVLYAHLTVANHSDRR